MGKGKTNGIMFNLEEMWIKIPCQNVKLTLFLKISNPAYMLLQIPTISLLKHYVKEKIRNI